jgi:coenzyme F420-reducing hydrogenase beta subunit
MNFDFLKSLRYIIGLVCILTFSYLSCTDKLDAKDSLIVITMVVSYYFGKDRTTPTPPST